MQFSHSEQVDNLLQELAKQVNQSPDKVQNNSLENLGKTMFSWTLAQLAEATDGDLIGPSVDAETIEFSSVGTDTRTIQSGALYIAVKGERFDGHAFIEQAVQQGAAAVLVSENIETIVPAVLVDDTRLALGHFACWHRQQMPVKKLVAVTGSNGKTSVKTMLNEVFSSIAPTLATQGNLNNDFGVPRTLLELRPEHEYAVIEMGANHKHEIDYLTALALPDIAIINNAAGAHLEGFGSLQGVIEGKGEIYQGLNQRLNQRGEKSGVAIVNTDSPGYTDWLAILDDLGVQNRISFGTDSAAQVQLKEVKPQTNEADGIELKLVLKTTGEVFEESLQLPVLGSHNAMNAAAVTAVALAAGLTWLQIKAPLQKFNGVAGRLQKNRISCGWLFDDSYNANPESVKAGINALTSLKGTAILCLGAMAEVGKTSAQAHQDIALYAKQQGIGYLFVYGKAAQDMPQAFGDQAAYFETHAELVAAVSEIITKFNNTDEPLNILVKGSRSAQMEQVAKPLINAFKQG